MTSSAEAAAAAGGVVHAAGLDCLVMVTDGTQVAIYARGDRNNVAAMVACASRVDVDRDIADDLTMH